MNKASQINQLHEEAMNLAKEVYLAQRKKDTKTATKWAKASFELEKKAAYTSTPNAAPFRQTLQCSRSCKIRYRA